MAQPSAIRSVRTMGRNSSRLNSVLLADASKSVDPGHRVRGREVPEHPLGLQLCALFAAITVALEDCVGAAQTNDRIAQADEVVCCRHVAGPVVMGSAARAQRRENLPCAARWQTSSSSRSIVSRPVRIMRLSQYAGAMGQLPRPRTLDDLAIADSPD